MNFQAALAAARARRASTDSASPTPVPAVGLAPAVLDLDRPLWGSRVAVLDLETTGLHQGARVVELAVVIIPALGESEPIKAYSTLVDCEVEIPWQATKVHGIEREHVKNAPTIDQVWPRLLDLTQGAVLCAHNTAYDHRILADEATLLDLQQLPERERWIDTLVPVKRLGGNGKPGTGTLAAACAARGIEKGRHTAGSDAYATAQLLPLVVEEVLSRPELGCPAEPTVRQWLDWQAGKREKPPAAPALPLGGASRSEAEELIRRGSLFCTASEWSASYRCRRAALWPVQLELPAAILRWLPRIEDGEIALPATLGKRRRVHVSWWLLEEVLWRALVERVRLHLEQGRRLLELWPLPGWSWDEVREAACAAREVIP